MEWWLVSGLGGLSATRGTTAAPPAPSSTSSPPSASFYPGKQQQQYSVMQLDGNSFCGDVVLGSFNMEYGEEDRIWGQKYEEQIFW